MLCGCDHSNLLPNSLDKDIRIPLDSEDMVTFFKDKETEITIKDYEYLLNEKQSTLDNYVQYLDTVCELTKIESPGY